MTRRTIDVLGETRAYSFERITRAIRLLERGMMRTALNAIEAR